MNVRAYSQRCALALLILFLPARSLAMDLLHYDLDSLVYLSTDIIVADLAKDARGNFTATVTESLYGPLHTGERLDALTPFLMFFQPLNDGQKVILFLDRRPRQYDFFHQDAAKSPFAVPPSGVYLIDEYGHVHEYFQQNNPGPYVAQGYMYSPERTVPTEKEDLALPSLDEVKARIAATVKSVQPIRDYLEKPATRDDVPGLMKLLASRPRYFETCQVPMTDMIGARVIEKLRSLNDPEIGLRLWSLSGADPLAFTANSGGNAATDSPSPGVKYLIATLSDRKKDASLRIAALHTLLNLSSFHTGGPHYGRYTPLPIDNERLATSADQIIATAKAIFNDRAENTELRSLSLSFLDLDSRQNLKNIQRVYARTKSPELQFAIERAFVDVSDALYDGLNPSSGPVASIIQLASEHGCVQPPDNQVTFLIRFYSTRAFNERGAAVITGRIVLKNIQSGQSFEVKNARSLGGHYGVLEGVLLFKLDQLSDFPAGVYTLGMEYAHQFNHLPTAGEVDEVPSVGHTVTIAIIDSPGGKLLSIPPVASAPRAVEPKLSKPAAQSLGNRTRPPAADHPDPNLTGVVYTFSGLTFPGAGPQHTETFQFTAPNFITSSTNLSASQLDSCANCTQSGTAVQFFPKGTLPLIVPADSVHLTDADGIIYGWVFAPGAFSATGTYTAFDDPPYIVSDVATVTVRAVRARPQESAKDAR